MIRKPRLPALLIGAFSLVAHAISAETPEPVQIRAVLHDPARPVASLFYTNEAGSVVPLNFRPKDLSRPFLTLPINGSLVLYNTANIDPENPAASVAAVAKLPANLKRAVVVALPAPEKDKHAYRLLIVDDSEKAFPYGESMVLPLVSTKMAIQAGEHTVPIHGGKITRVPSVKQVNEFNMAQTNFHYESNGSWVTFAERQLQYLQACRRIFIIHVTPGALQPTVTTIVDINRKG